MKRTTRLERRNRTDIEYGNGSNLLFDMMDDAVKGTWFINDEEYDYLCDKLPRMDELIDVMMQDVSKGKMTFSQKREALNVVNGYLDKYYSR